MDRAKIIFIAIAVVAVGAAAGLGFSAKSKFAEAARDEAEKVRIRKQLNHIYEGSDRSGNEIIFPSPENIAKIKEMVTELEDSRATITGALSKCNIPLVEGTTPSAFVQKLGQIIKLYTDKAPIVDGAKSVSPGFAFGFDAYVGANPAMPSEEEVPLLGQQLVVISWLTGEMFKSNVSRITMIKREAKDQATLSRSATDDSRRNRRRDEVEEEDEEEEKPRKKKKGKKGKSDEPPPPLFTSQKFILEFTARQNALMDLLNGIAAMPNAFCVVSGMTISKSAKDLRLPVAPEVVEEKSDEEESVKENAAARRAARRAARKSRSERKDKDNEEAKAAAPVAKDSELPPEMRVMSGPDVDPPLAVHLEIDVYTFGKESK
jgi:hypothetical protein